MNSDLLENFNFKMTVNVKSSVWRNVYKIIANCMCQRKSHVPKTMKEYTHTHAYFCYIEKRYHFETPLCHIVSNYNFLYCYINNIVINPRPSLTRVLTITMSPDHLVKVTLVCYVCSFTWTCFLCSPLRYSWPKKHHRHSKAKQLPHCLTLQIHY